jgi:hypothetical protein
MLRESSGDPFWDDHPDLLVWILHIGGSFSSQGTVRDDYKALLQENRGSRFVGMYDSLEELVQILSLFVWSEKAYRAQVEEFWKETHLGIETTQ